MLERLERNRVLHLASSHVQLSMAADAKEKLARAEKLLQKMLDSRAFSAAELFLRVRQRGRPVFSKEEIRTSSPRSVARFAQPARCLAPGGARDRAQRCGQPPA